MLWFIIFAEIFGRGNSCSDKKELDKKEREHIIINISPVAGVILKIVGGVIVLAIAYSLFGHQFLKILSSGSFLLLRKSPGNGFIG